MIVSAVRSRQVNPVTSAQTVAVASRRLVDSPRKVNLQARNEPPARSVRSSASDICASEISEAAPGHIPGSFVPLIVAGNTGADFSSKRVHVQLQTEPALADLREIDADRVEIEAAREGERADAEPVVLPRSRAAELRKTLAKPGRYDRDFTRTENARLQSGCRKACRCEDRRWCRRFRRGAATPESLKLSASKSSRVRQAKRWGRRRLRISANVHGDSVCREGPEQAPARAVEDGAQIQGKLDPGGFDHDAKRGFRVAGDLERVHDHRTRAAGPRFFRTRSAILPVARRVRPRGASRPRPATASGQTARMPARSSEPKKRRRNFLKAHSSVCFSGKRNALKAASRD